MRDKTEKTDDPKTYFEQVAETTWGAYISNVECKWILRAAEMCGKRGTFLEIGCDGGRWSKMLSDLGWQAVCTDINADNLRLCQARLPAARCHLVAKDENRLPCDDSSFELVLCIEVIPVIISNWFLSETGRVLRKKGIVIGVFNNRRSLRGCLLHLGNSVRGKFDWYGGDYVKWKQQAAAHGFQVISEEGLCWFPFRRSSNSRLVPFFTRLEIWLGLRKLAAFSPWIVFLARKTE